jgi:hypothetical protein
MMGAGYRAGDTKPYEALDDCLTYIQNDKMNVVIIILVVLTDISNIYGKKLRDLLFLLKVSCTVKVFPAASAGIIRSRSTLFPGAM